MFDLQSTTVLVTGGSKGIGRGIASVFAAAGADVAIAARSAYDIDAAVADLDTLGTGKVLGVRADVCDPMSCANLAAAVVETFGGLDIVCANAGIFPEAPLATMTPREVITAAQPDIAREVGEGYLPIGDACQLGWRGKMIRHRRR